MLLVMVMVLLLIIIRRGSLPPYKAATCCLRENQNTVNSTASARRAAAQQQRGHWRRGGCSAGECGYGEREGNGQRDRTAAAEKGNVGWENGAVGGGGELRVRGLSARSRELRRRASRRTHGRRRRSG